MFDVLPQILDVVMFSRGESGGMVLTPKWEALPRDKRDHHRAGSFPMRREVFPSACDVRTLGAGEGFIEDMRQTITDTRPSRLLVIAPVTDARFLSADLQTRFSGMSLEHIVISVAVDILRPGAMLGVLLPVSSLASESSRRFRDNLTEKAVLRYVVQEGDPMDGGDFTGHIRVRLQIIVLEVGRSDSPVVRFFRCPDLTSEEKRTEVLADLTQLARQGGGTTKFGYVLREGVPTGSRLLYEMHDPRLAKRVEELKHIGPLQRLSEEVTIRPGFFHLVADADALRQDPSGNGAPVIEGRNVRPDGTLDLAEVRYYAPLAALPQQLQAGDILVRAVVAPQERLRAAVVSADMLPLTAGHTVHVLRIKPESSVDSRFLCEYLRCQRACDWVNAQRTGLSLTRSMLGDLPVPVPDRTLLAALQSLQQAKVAFDRWWSESDQAISSLFDFESAPDARLHLLSAGRRMRQHLTAGEQADDYRYRFRTLLPHPIAYRWRAAEAAKPDLEGYIQVLECAEAAVCYLACVAVGVLVPASGSRIGYLNVMAMRLFTRGGTNMGDWIAILREIKDSKALRETQDHVPLYEASRFLDDEEVNSALQHLKARRDDQAHGRGPKGAAIAKDFAAALANLEILLRSAEFLADYPLRYIETTRRDSLRHITEYQYRDMVGDHPLVPLHRGESTESELEAGSLYLVDRTGSLHLLRPLLLRQECPLCGTWATFFLDGYRKDDDVCVMKSMEHGHLIERADVSAAFRHIGLLPPNLRKTSGV